MDWGLAWSEAAPYAADLGMKYEQARRLNAESALWDMELQEKMEQTEHATNLNRDVRAAQKAITENKNGILAGDIDSYLRAKNALASGTGYSWVKISDSKIGIMDKNGNINQDSIRDLSSKEWKNPAARIAELEKSAKTIMDMASQYRSDVEKNKKDEWEREKFYAEEEGKNKRNKADNLTKLAVARLGKEAALLGLSGGGGGGRSGVSVDEKHVAAATNYAARAVLGVNVSANADDKNTIRFYTPDGTEVPVTDKQRDLINKGAQWILTNANNTAATRKVDIDVALGDSALTLQHSVATAKTVNPERKKQIEEQAKRVSALFTNNKGLPTTGGIFPLVGTPDRYRTAGRGLEVTGTLSTSSPFGQGIPGGLAGSEWNSTPIQYVTDVLGETYVD